MSTPTILLILNTLWLAYLTYLIYVKNKTSTNSSKSVLGKNNKSLSFTKIHLTPFSPFDDLTGQHSFILFLLDNTNSGVIITSLQHRHSNRLYAKTIKNGQANQNTLSKEESEILKKILNNN